MIEKSMKTVGMYVNLLYCKEGLLWTLFDIKVCKLQPFLFKPTLVKRKALKHSDKILKREDCFCLFSDYIIQFIVAMIRDYVLFINHWFTILKYYYVETMLNTKTSKYLLLYTCLNYMYMQDSGLMIVCKHVAVYV